MPGEGHASPYLAEFAPHERQGRVEPEVGPSTAPGTAYATVTSDSPYAAGLWGVVPEIDTEAIRNFFRGASEIFSFAIHYSLNGHIEVEGDTARARWYLFMPCTVAAGNQAMWRAGIDHEAYARVDGTWMFRHKRSEPLMSVPFETGWAKTRFA